MGFAKGEKIAGRGANYLAVGCRLIEFISKGVGEFQLITSISYLALAGSQPGAAKALCRLARLPGWFENWFADTRCIGRA